MTIEFSSSIILLSLLLTFITIILVNVTKNRFKTKSNFPPGPRRVPFIGHLHLLVSRYPPHRVLKDLSLNYGSLMQLQLGEIPTLVVSSSEMAKEILKTHDETFAYRPSYIAVEVITYKNTDIGFSPYGAYWRNLRKICALEMFSVKRVQSFQILRYEEVSNLCRWIASHEGSLMNLSERLTLTAYEVATRATLGKRTKEQEAFMSIIKDIVEMGSGFLIGDLYPSIKLIRLLSGMERRIKRMFKKADTILQNIVDEHREARSHVAKGIGERKSQEDLLDVLLKYQDDDNEQPLTTDNIKAVLMDMFVAGTETAAKTVEWAMSEIMKHPTVLQKVQDELRQVFNEKGYVDETCLHEVTYLKLAIKETMRLHPTVPLLLPRESIKPCTIAGYDIPAKTRVFVNAYAIGRDPKYWEDAETFRLERFADKLHDYKGNSFEFIPFGAGKRICPGMSFGLANIELQLAMLLFHFDWILPSGMKPEQIDLTESFGGSCGKANPLCVIPVVKIPLPAK